MKNSAKNLPKATVSSADIEMIDVSLNRSGTDGNVKAKSDKTNENEFKGPAVADDKEKKKDSIGAELREVALDD